MKTGENGGPRCFCALRAQPLPYVLMCLLLFAFVGPSDLTLRQAQLRTRAISRTYTGLCADRWPASARWRKLAWTLRASVSASPPLRGGGPDGGFEGGSTAVSDRGLLESVGAGDEGDKSVPQHWNRYNAELSEVFNRKGGWIPGMWGEEKQNDEDRGEAAMKSMPALPKPFSLRDYARVVGVDMDNMQAQAGEEGTSWGVRLRECDEALLEEEDAAYEMASNKDAATPATDAERLSQKARRLARIKALLRCKASAMTAGVLEHQGLDGVSIPVFEKGTEQQRAALKKLRQRWRCSEPEEAETGLPLEEQSKACQGQLKGQNQSILSEAGFQTSIAGAAEGIAATGPLQVMEHPYLVIRNPNSSTLLYECEQGDLDEGMRVEGVQTESPASDTGPWKVMNMTLQTQLLEAAEYGDYDGLKLALDRGANIDTGPETPYQVSALHLAARGNHLGCMQLLLQSGQDVNAEDHCRATPLHYASDRGCLEAAELLLAAGANISAGDCYGRTPLHRAAVDSPRRFARALIDAGADVDARDLVLDNALHVAAIWGNEGVARLMLAHGARGDDLNRFGHCPVVLADTWERLAVARLLREHLRRLGAPLGYLSHLKPLARPDGMPSMPGFDPRAAGEGLEQLLRKQAAGGGPGEDRGKDVVPGARGLARKRRTPGGGAGSSEAWLQALGNGMREEGNRSSALGTGGRPPRLSSDIVSLAQAMGVPAEEVDRGWCNGGAGGGAAGSGMQGAAVEGPAEEGGGDDDQLDSSDPYSVRYSKFWQNGGLSGLPLAEDWGYTPSGKKCTSGLEAAEPYYSVYADEDAPVENEMKREASQL